jgi:hypothetical protein
MANFRERPIAFSGETPIAVMLQGKFQFLRIQMREFEEDEKVELTPEFIRLPIDPVDLEFFGENQILYQKLYGLRGGDVGEAMTFGFIYDGELYMKNLEIRKAFIKWSRLDLDCITVRFRDFNPNLPQMLLNQDKLCSYNELFPLEFFLYQRFRLLHDYGTFDPEILMHVCPKSTQSEVAAICTKQGCIGVITKNNVMHLGQQFSDKTTFNRLRDGAYFGRYYHIELEKKIPLEENILDTYFPNLTPPFKQFYHSICSFEYGAAGGFVVDHETQSIYFPRFFLRRAKLVHGGGKRGFAVKIKHTTWTLTISKNSNGFLEDYLRRSDLRFEESTSVTNYNLASYPGNWGLFDRSMVLFPGAFNLRVFTYDSTQDGWFTAKGNKEIPTVSVCLDSKEEVTNAVVNRSQFIPADIGKLIVSFTYDHFLEETRDDQYQDNRNDFIKVSIRANDAKKLLLERD